MCVCVCVCVCERERERERERKSKKCVCKDRKLTILGMFTAGLSPFLSLMVFATVLSEGENKS